MDLSNLKAASTITIDLLHPVTGEALTDSSVTCNAPSSIKYKSAVMKVAKKYADKDGKAFLEMDDNEIDDAINKSAHSVIDTVSAVTVSCNLTMNGEKLSVDEFKKLIESEEYSWIVQQIKGELDAGKLSIQAKPKD